MTGLLDRLNLRPQERRMLVAVAIIVFGALNLTFVWPHFQDWAQAQNDLDAARKKLATFKGEIADKPSIEAKLRSLEGGGSTVLPEDQANNLVRAINSQAALSRVMTTRITPRVNLRTGVAANPASQFFEEQLVNVSIQNTGDKELVDFLLALSNSDMMVRVRDLDIRPDPSSGNSRLMGSIALVASYQKKPQAKAQAKTPARTSGSVGPTKIPAKTTTP